MAVCQKHSPCFQGCLVSGEITRPRKRLEPYQLVGPGQCQLRVYGSQGRRAWRAGVRAGFPWQVQFQEAFARRRGQGSGHRGRRPWRAGGRGRDLNCGCPGPSLTRIRWAGWLQRLPGLGGVSGGSLPGFTWGGTGHGRRLRVDPPVPSYPVIQKAVSAGNVSVFCPGVGR